MRPIAVVAVFALMPGLLAAQQDPVERLRVVLPADQAAQVIAVVEDARDRGLPALSVARRVLEGVAKGRSASEVTAAAHALVADLAAARGALEQGGRTPSGPEIESGAIAMSHGVDGAVVSAFASSAPSGRSLAVPLAVIGSLVDRGLAPDDALSAVRAGLEVQATDAELLDMPGHGARLMADGMRPADVGRALGRLRRGVGVPPGHAVPPGVPANGGGKAKGRRPAPNKPPK